MSDTAEIILWFAGLVVAIIGSLIGAVAWFSRKTLKDIYREIERLDHEVEGKVKMLQDDIVIVQDRLHEMEKKDIKDSTYLETFRDTVKQMQEEMGRLDGSFNRWHERLTELKDMIEHKLYKKSRD